MSVLIKGMRMPHSCADCDFARLSMSSTGFATGFVCNCPENDFNNVDCCVQNHIRHRGCALAELPERHGRLFDSDEVKKVLDDLPDSEDKWSAIALLEWAIDKRWCIEAEGKE